jgi:hypothetical protein
MIRNMIMASALAASLLALTTASSSAQAVTTVPAIKHDGVELIRWGGHGGWHGGGGWHGAGGWHGSGFHGHRGFSPLWLVPGVAVGAYYADSYYGGCGWLYRQASYTGSPYWWHRYQECVSW